MSLKILFTNQHFTFRKRAEMHIKGQFPKFNQVTIQDLISEAFTDIWAKRMNVCLICSPQTYLNKVCYNKAVDLTRKEARQLYWATYLNTDPAKDTIDKERLETVADTIALLTPRKRVLMEMLYDVKVFDSEETPVELKVVYKNGLGQKTQAVQKQLNYPSGIALRQEKSRIIAFLQETLA